MGLLVFGECCGAFTLVPHDMAEADEGRHAGWFLIEHSAKHGLGLVKATQLAQIVCKLSLRACVARTSGDGGLKCSDGGAYVATAAHEMAEANEGRHAGRLFVQDTAQNGFGLVEAAKLAQIVCKLSLCTRVAGIGGDGRLKCSDGRAWVATAAHDMAEANEGRHAGRLFVQDTAQNGFGLVKAAKFAQIVCKLGLRTRVAGVGGDGRLKRSDGGAKVATAAHDMAEADEGRHAGRLFVQDTAQNGFGLVKAAKFAQIVCKLGLRTRVAGVGGDGRLKCSDGGAYVATAAHDMAEANEGRHAGRLFVQDTAQNGFGLVKAAKFAQIVCKLGLRTRVAGVGRDGRLKCRDGRVWVATAAHDMAEADEGRHAGRLFVQDTAQHGFGLVKAAEFAQIVCKLSLCTRVAGVGGDGGLKCSDGGAKVATAAHDMAEADEGRHAGRLFVQDTAQHGFGLVKAAKFAQIVCKLGLRTRVAGVGSDGRLKRSDGGVQVATAARDVAEADQGRQAGRFLIEDPSEHRLGLVEAAKLAQIVCKLGFCTRVARVGGDGGLKCSDGGAYVATAAHDMAEANEGRHAGRLFVQDTAQNGFGLVKAAKFAQIVCKLGLRTRVAGVGGDGRLKCSDGGA